MALGYANQKLRIACTEKWSKISSDLWISLTDVGGRGRTAVWRTPPSSLRQTNIYGPNIYHRRIRQQSETTLCRCIRYWVLNMIFAISERLTSVASSWHIIGPAEWSLYAICIRFTEWYGEMSDFLHKKVLGYRYPSLILLARSCQSNPREFSIASFYGNRLRR